MLKLLQLNIFQGKYLDRIINFAKEYDIDILQLQEVSSGKMSKGGRYNYPKGLETDLKPNPEHVGKDCFEEIKDRLDMGGEKVATVGLIGDQHSWEGNATIFSKKLKLLSKEVVWHKDFTEVDEDFNNIPELGRASLILNFDLDGNRLTTINTHMAWGPTSEDEQYKIDQAKKLYNYMTRITSPFILTGDFNVDPKTDTSNMFNDFGRNLILENGITNTLNPRLHPAKHLFPKGLAVDYVFISKDIKLNSFKVLDDTDLSDHYGILVELDVS